MIKVKFDGKYRTYGLFRLEPNCPISKTVATVMRGKFVKMAFAQLLIENGGEVFYSGCRDALLDKIGFQFVEEKKK